MKSVTVRKAKCGECPYRAENAHCMDVEQKQKIDDTGAVFPCHEELRAVVGSDNSGVEIYAQLVDEFVVCKGRAEEIGME